MGCTSSRRRSSDRPSPRSERAGLHGVSVSRGKVGVELLGLVPASTGPDRHFLGFSFLYFLFWLFCCCFDTPLVLHNCGSEEVNQRAPLRERNMFVVVVITVACR